MTRHSENKGHGWDFIEVGKIYQYKEDWLICMVKILEDNSIEKEYNFLIEPQGECELTHPFDVSAIKGFTGVYSGMSEFFLKVKNLICQEKNCQIMLQN